MDELERMILGDVLAAYRAYVEPRFDALIRGDMTGEPIGLLSSLQPGDEFEQQLDEPRGLLAALRLSSEPEARREQLDEPTGAVGLFQMLGGELPSPLVAADPLRCPRRPDPISTRPRVRLRYELSDERTVTASHHAAGLPGLRMWLDERVPPNAATVEQAIRDALLPPQPVEQPPAGPPARAHLTVVPDPDDVDEEAP